MLSYIIQPTVHIHGSAVVFYGPRDVDVVAVTSYALETHFVFVVFKIVFFVLIWFNI